jgi:Ca2+-binding RTX toxin-like protein
MAIKKGNNSANTINGDYTNDDIYGYGGNDYLDGKLGNDRIWGGDGADRLLGDAGNDSLWGDAGNDTISGGIGDDMLYGGIGDDRMWGDAGSDRLWGGDGNDQIQTNGVEFDIAYGGNGNDTLTGAANDLLYGESGNDIFVAELPSNAPPTTHMGSTYNGGSGSDTLKLSMSHTDLTLKWYVIGDTINYVSQNTDYDNQRLSSYSGIERIEINGTTGVIYHGGYILDGRPSSEGRTVIGSNSSKDEFFGGYGNDHLDGRGGNDVFEGGEGTNILVGGAGRDEFRLRDTEGLSYIKGFEGASVAGGDFIRIFSGSLENPYDTTVTALSNGHTQIKMYDDGVLLATMDIDKIGLKAGEDYWLV